MTTKLPAPFWTVTSHQAPKTFKSFTETPPQKKTFTVPNFTTGFFADYLDTCPHCNSNNVQGVPCEESAVLELGCGDCHHQWMGIDHFLET